MPIGKQKVIVACCDAGGAEVVGVFINKNAGRFDFSVWAVGPAAGVFTRRGIAFKNASGGEKTAREIFDAVSAVLVLTGTSAAGSPFERLFWAEGKKRGAKTVAYLDHWVNYRERFGYPEKNWRKNLPDEIWAGDRYALALAGRFFKAPARLEPNGLYDEMKKGAVGPRNKENSRTILFIGEPPHGQKVLERLLGVLTKVKLNYKVIARSHPSEDGTAYKKASRRFKDCLSVEVSKGRTLIEDIGRSGIVIGIESATLPLAAAVGRKTISFMPDIGHRCRLPQGDIIKIRTDDSLKRILLKSKI